VEEEPQELRKNGLLVVELMGAEVGSDRVEHVRKQEHREEKHSLDQWLG